MKKSKRLIALTLAGATMMSMTSCGKKKTGDEYTEDGRMIITIANSVAINDNTEVEQWLEKKYNVEIKTYGYSANYYDKLATLIASKQTPDVMMINDISNWEPLAKQGALAPIDMEVVKQAAPDHYAHINEKNEKMWELGKVDGTLYAIPKSMGEEYNTVMVWNKNWLDALGIKKVPETLEEYEAAFEKIKNGDPDGNGKNDTYPMSGNGGTYYRQFDWVFGAYGVMPEMWGLEDGKVVNGTVTDRAREALTKLNEWYEKGYIHPEFLTDDQSAIAGRFDKQMIAINNTSLSNVSDKTPNGRANLANGGEGYAERITYGPLPEGPYGDRGDWLWGPLSNFVCFGAHLKGNTEKQKIILNILNDLNYNEAVALVGKYGFMGESYEYNDEAQGKSSGIKQLGNYGKDANANAELGINFFNLLSNSDWAGKEIAQQYLEPGYVEEVEKLAKWESRRDLLMRANTKSTLTYAKSLQTLKIQAYSEFINGTRDIEKDWDAFVNEYMSNGGEILQQEAQEFYDSVIK